MENKEIKYKLLQRNAFSIIALVLFTLFFGMILVAYLNNIPDAYATGTCATGWRVSADITIDCHNECRRIWMIGSDFFVPTATADEWRSFRTNPHNHAWIGYCPAQAPDPAPTPTPDPTPTPTPDPTVTKRVFITSTWHTGNMGGLTGADEICRARATEANLSGTWRALLSTNTVDARDRIGSNWTQLTTMDGRIIATSKSELWGGTIQTNINLTEQNRFLLVRDWEVWTGTTYRGRAKRATCLNWTHGTSGVSTSNGSFIGRQDRTDQEWVDSGEGWIHCNWLLHLYCVEQ